MKSSFQVSTELKYLFQGRDFIRWPFFQLVKKASATKQEGQHPHKDRLTKYEQMYHKIKTYNDKYTHYLQNTCKYYTHICTSSFSLIFTLPKRYI